MVTLRRLAAATLVWLMLCLALTVPVFAAEYNCGAYGAGTYQTNVCAATTEQPSGLVNTGQKLLPIIIPTLLILIGTIGLFAARRKKHIQPPAPPSSG